MSVFYIVSEIAHNVAYPNSSSHILPIWRYIGSKLRIHILPDKPVISLIFPLRAYNPKSPWFPIIIDNTSPHSLAQPPESRQHDTACAASAW